MTDPDFAVQNFLPYLLNQAAETSSLSFEKVYKAKYGMRRTEWRVLFHLGLYGRLTAREISHRAGLHKTKISRAVQRLEEGRMLARDRDDHDRRVDHLELTAKGRAAYADLSATARDYEAQLVADMTAQEVATLKTALHRLMRSTP